MRFTKMQGLGNDYVYVNCFEESVETPELMARRLSDRHFGVGADGLILIRPSNVADCRMEMYNADGSRGAMCGNGIRCVAKYVYEAGLVNRERMVVETDSGLKSVYCRVQDGKVRL
ncbi:MAG: diaminopimelate epimerase, partial [Lachnospiraceae bacterium]|nr:diaminopimelate epimerase [Lachnospiraceae bacterium]